MECGGEMSYKVLVLGASGMLGSMVTKVLSGYSDLQVIGTSRTFQYREQIPPKAGWRYFDAEVERFAEVLDGADWVINCVGVIKPMIDESSTNSVLNAININSMFPHKLALAAELRGINIIQIATDCVYSGSSGLYSENSPHDATDVYGKTKSLGEVKMSNVYNLRCSIIGPEKGSNKSLLEWVLHQPQGATINGYTNHLWNGITTHAFAKLCYGVIQDGLGLGNSIHIIPEDIVSKYELLQIITDSYGRKDIKVVPTEAPVEINRTLKTMSISVGGWVWEIAGYSKPPTVEQMIKDMERYTHVG